MTTQSKIHGLTCPNCGGVVPVPEGARIVTCPYCDVRSLVEGDRGVRRWQVTGQIEREQALETVKGFFSGMNKASDLKREAEVRELFLVYLPYWRVKAFVAGWLFGRVRSGEDSTKPAEFEVMEEMRWNDAATDVSEFGVHRVSVSDDALEPYDAEQLHAQAMVFEPVESRTEAVDEARQHFRHRVRERHSLKQKFFEKIHYLRQRLSLVYYPLWVARYEYRQRNYQVVVDGVRGEILYGKAPGNILYRAAMLVGMMAAGTFVLVNGTIISGLVLANSNGDGDSFFLLLLPIVLGIGLVAFGYRRFRHGEEVETLQKGARKAALGPGKSRGFLLSGMSILEELADIDTSEFQKLQ